MRRATALLLVLAGLACAPAPPGEMRVTLVGIDGATWKVIDPMLARGELPGLAAMVEQGARADLRSRRPLVSPAIWTTIATGEQRGRHGIRGFLSGGRGTLVSSRDRKVPALWTLASRNGRHAAVLGWWATYPAEAIDGVVVSDRTLKSRRESVRTAISRSALLGTDVRDLVRPPDAVTAIDALLAAAARAEDAPSDPDAGGGSDASDIRVTMRREDATLARSLLALRESHGPFDLELVLLRGVDPVSHYFWRFHEPDAAVYREADRPDAEERARVGDPVAAHYRFADGLLRELGAPSRDHVVLVVSDHGFEAGYQRLRGGTTLFGKHSSEEAAVGVFVAAGGPVRAAVALDEVAILDVAPTVLRLLGLPIAEELPGHVIDDALDPQWLARHPANRVDAYTGPPNDIEDLAPGTERHSPGDAALEDELRALGYIE